MKYVNRKAMIIRSSGRSSDFITPSFGFGCLYKCAYCYMRRHLPEGLTIAQNTQEIIDSIENHLSSLMWPKLSNQTHYKYYTYDFSCNEDYILHAKYHDWRLLFDYFKNNKKAMGTAATKYINKDLLQYNSNYKVRIRYSLMPQELSDVLEPHTSKVIDRIKAVNDFYDAGYDVHLNYSPVIVYPNSKQAYTELFELVDKHVRDDIKEKVKCEVIFMTHNDKMHDYNLKRNPVAESYLWHPIKQEYKKSEYGNINIRYEHKLKKMYIDRFLNLHNNILPWQDVRYIF